MQINQLNGVPSAAQWFSVVDLANAFFSVPVHPKSQYWFAFNFNGKGCTFTCVKDTVSQLPFTMIYWKPVSLYSWQREQHCYSMSMTSWFTVLLEKKKDTVALPKHLTAGGQKTSLSKLQFVQQKVTILGHVIKGEDKYLSPKRVEAIQGIPKPRTKKQMLSFLGMCRDCRTSIPN